MKLFLFLNKTVSIFKNRSICLKKEFYGEEWVQSETIYKTQNGHPLSSKKTLFTETSKPV